MWDATVFVVCRGTVCLVALTEFGHLCGVGRYGEGWVRVLGGNIPMAEYFYTRAVLSTPSYACTVVQVLPHATRNTHE